MPVRAASEAELLESFVSWLENIHLGKVVLAGHNALAFDSRVLLNAASRCSNPILFWTVAGFANTLLGFRQEHPSLKQKCKLSDLAAHFGAGDFQAHNAAEDVRVLQKMAAHHLADATLPACSISWESADQRNSSQLKAARLLRTFNVAIRAKAIS